jgi:hypothetical protein
MAESRNETAFKQIEITLNQVPIRMRGLKSQLLKFVKQARDRLKETENSATQNVYNEKTYNQQEMESALIAGEALKALSEQLQAQLEKLKLEVQQAKSKVRKRTAVAMVVSGLLGWGFYAYTNPDEAFLKKITKEGRIVQVEIGGEKIEAIQYEGKIYVLGEKGKKEPTKSEEEEEKPEGHSLTENFQKFATMLFESEEKEEKEE